MLVHVAPLLDLLGCGEEEVVLRTTSDREVDFGHDDDLVARQVELFDGFAQNDFGAAVGVDVGSVEGVDTQVVGGFDVFEG